VLDLHLHLFGPERPSSTCSRTNLLLAFLAIHASIIAIGVLRKGEKVNLGSNL
jgi:hypothetical protein